MSLEKSPFMRSRNLIVLLALLLTACSKENAWDCVKTSGPEVTETRSLPPFRELRVYDNMDVLIVQGPEYRVELSAGRNIVKKISSEVTEGVLSLVNTNKCNFVRGYKKRISIRVTLPSVEQVTNFGVGPLSMDPGFRQDKLFVRAENSGDTYIRGEYEEVNTSSHGNGDIYLSGAARRLNIYTFGTNYTRAENFRVSDYIFVSTESIGDVYLNAENLGLMHYYIYSIGNIYYKGNPQTIENLGENTASGRLIRQD